MSKNKRSGRTKSGAVLSVLPTEETSSNNYQSVESNEAGSENNAIGKHTNLFARLKNHWWAVGLVALLSLGAFGAGLKYLDDSAKQEKAANAGKSNLQKSAPSLLSKINPFVEPPLPSATPQLSKSYIYAGSRMLAVEDANAASAPPADLAVWRPSTGFWYVLGSAGSQQTAFQWGGTDDRPAPGDYDGDGKTDFSVFRLTNGTWYVNNSSNGNTTQLTYGAGTDTRAQADFDGDGKTDMAVFRDQSPNGYWYLVLSSTQASVASQFGLGSDTPAPADYDGDGKADLAVWRSSTRTFYYVPSSGGSALGQGLPNATGTEVVSADYDGDGRADFAVKSGSLWHIHQSSDGQTVAISWQAQIGTQQPVPNDYDGDGKVDIAVWSSTDGNWYLRQSSQLAVNNGLRQVAWGQAGDYPVPAFYRR